MQKKKRGKSIKINITLTNRWLYTLILIGILAAVGVGVYAYGTSNPSVFGHSYNEIQPCAANQVLKMNSAGNAWECSTISVTETDPQVGALTNRGLCVADGSAAQCTYACGANQILRMNAAGTAWTCSPHAFSECFVVESPSFTTNPIVFCPDGYMSVGGGGSCQSALDRLTRTKGGDAVFLFGAGNLWTASCKQGTTNIEAPAKAYVICCK